MDQSSASELARQIVTAYLILEDEKPGRLLSPRDAQAWSSASRPFSKLMDEIMERTAEGDEWVAVLVIGELVNLLGATIAHHLILRNEVALKRGENPMTEAEWWRVTSEGLESAGE